MRPLSHTACALALTLLTACATTAPQPSTGSTPSTLPEPTTDGSALPVLEIPNLTERALLLMLVDRQMYEPAAVRRALAGGPELRERLAAVLGQIGDPRAVDPLKGLLLDEAVPVRRAAAFALGELEDDAAAKVLLLAARDDDRETGRLAVEAAAKAGLTLAEVAAALEPLGETEARQRLVPFLFRFDEPGIVPAAVAALGADDREIHRRAAYALTRNPRPEGLPAIRDLVADPDPRVRAWAARALGLIGEAGDLDRLAPLLEDEPGPLIQALKAGFALLEDGRAAPTDAWRRRLVELLDDPRPQVKLTALEVAGLWLLDDELGDALVMRATGLAGEPWERAPALGSLARGRHPRTPELAQTFARSDQPGLRAAAATAAAQAPSPEMAELLERLTHDPVARVRIAALDGLLALATDPAEIAADALTDTDPAVRASLFSWLAEHPVAPVERLGEAVVQSMTDGNAESSVLGVRALAARAQAEPLERGTLVALLENLAQYRPSWLVRREASQALAALDRPVPPVGTVDTGKTVEVYESLLYQTARPRTVRIDTDRGAVTVRLDCPRAPLTCHNFLSLAGQGFYDNLPFHRVVPDFVVQGGDPRGDGFGGPPYTIRDEIHPLRYERGVVGMALAGPDTGGSQFFVTLAPQPHLDGGYTAFGEVTSGLEVVERIVPGDRIRSITEIP